MRRILCIARYSWLGERGRLCRINRVELLLADKECWEEMEEGVPSELMGRIVSVPAAGEPS